MKKIKIKELPYDFVVLNTIGEGSCLLHSILQGFNKTYLHSSNTERRKIVKNLRFYLSKVLDEKEKKSTYYNNLSRGEIGEISKFVPSLKKENMEKYLNSYNWLDQRFLELISNQLNIDILIYDQYKNNFYITGDNEIYLKGRNTVLINYLSETHFETMGVINNKINTFFSPDSPVILDIKNNFYKKKV